jgi:peptide/nickel transport system permease protein
VGGYADETVWQQFRHLLLPSLVLGSLTAAVVARLTRSAMLEVLGQDYVRTARAKGLKESAVVLRHALRNAAIPIITVVGNNFGGLLVGAVLTETVFGLPGLGREIVQAIGQRDRELIAGGVLFMAGIFVTVNLIVDLTYAWFDPRVRYE